MDTAAAPTRGCVHVDGAWFAFDDAVVPVTDRGFLYGDGVFESLRTRDGVPVRLHAHLDRLVASAAAVAIEGAPEPDALAAVVHEAVERAGIADAYVRITLTRGAGAGLDPAEAGTPRLVILVGDLPAAPPAAGVTLSLLAPSAVPEHPPPQVKATAGFLRQTLGRHKARRAGYDDALWRDPDANVTEATSSNVFAVTGKLVHTPPESVCLPGITRADALGAARGLGLATSTAPLTTEALLAAHEVFLTNAVAVIVAVRRVAGVELAPGPVTRELAGVLAGIV